jgi:hypothetical protein
MDKRADSVASQLILPKKNVISVFLLRNWMVMFSGDISVSVSHTFYSEWF